MKAQPKKLASFTQLIVISYFLVIRFRISFSFEVTHRRLIGYR